MPSLDSLFLSDRRKAVDFAEFFGLFLGCFFDLGFVVSVG
jgi:hypothetical protein